MKRLRHILQSKHLIKIITIIIFIITLLYTNYYPFKSKYTKDDKEFIGIVTKYEVKEDKITIEIKAKEKLLITYKYQDKEFNNLLVKYEDYTKNVLNIEREQKKPRKDYSCYSDIKNQIFYMYDELYNPTSYEWGKIDDKNEIIKILKTYMEKYFNVTDKEAWFNNIKDMTDELGYCSNMKEYKENPDKYKGSVADISTVIRVALTSRSMTPDLYEIMRLLGKDRIKERITKIEQL